MKDNYSDITSKQVKDFCKDWNVNVRVSTVPSKKPHKLIQAWSHEEIPVDFKKQVLIALHGTLGDVIDQVSFNYGNVNTYSIWMYQSDWAKIFEYFKILKDIKSEFLKLQAHK